MAKPSWYCPRARRVAVRGITLGSVPRVVLGPSLRGDCSIPFACSPASIQLAHWCLRVRWGLPNRALFASATRGGECRPSARGCVHQRTAAASGRLVERPVRLTNVW